MANCCTPKFLKVVASVAAAQCASMCGLTCTSVGLLVGNQSCAFCTQALHADDHCADPFQLPSVHTPSKSSVQTCNGRECILCNGSDLQHVPANAKVYISARCSGIVYDRNNITIYNSRRTPFQSLQLNVCTNVVLGGFPLTSTNKLIVANDKCLHTQPVAVHVNVSGMSADDDSCIFSVIQHKNNYSLAVNIAVPVNVVNKNLSCLLGAFPDAGRKNLKGSIRIGNITVANNKTFYAAAIANVDGTFVSASNYTVIYLQTENGELTLEPKQPSVSLTKLLSIFGSTYEIRYYNPDGSDTAQTRFPWLARANHILTLSAIIVGGALVTV